MLTIDLSPRVALITGAVGNLGRAAAAALQAAGARTVLLDRSTERLREAYRDLAASPDHLLVGEVDLTDADAVGGAVQQAVTRFGRMDVVVNTAGAFRGGQPVHEGALEDWEFLFKVNVRTAMLVSRAAVAPMLEQGGGAIINVGSRAALQGPAGLAAYSAAKSALLRLTESMAAELKPHGIRVNAVLPGTIDTPQNRAAMPGADTSSWVQPEAIADVILCLASDLTRAVSGAAIPV